MKKNELKALNKRAKKLEEPEVFGMTELAWPPDMPLGCTTVLDTGWETNPRAVTPIGNCVPSGRDFGSCAGPCWWPAQVPDNIVNFPGYQNQCVAFERDWRNLNYVIKR